MIKIKVAVDKDILQKSMYCGTDKGEGMVIENCAIAIAVRDLFPEATVGAKDIDFGIPGILTLSDLPKEASAFIKKFDKLRKYPERRLELDPIEFEIKVPDEIVDSIGIEEVETILKQSVTLSLV